MTQTAKVPFETHTTIPGVALGGRNAQPSSLLFTSAGQKALFRGLFTHRHTQEGQGKPAAGRRWMYFKAHSFWKKMLRQLQGPNTRALQDLAGMAEHTVFSTCLSSLLIPITKARPQEIEKV